MRVQAVKITQNEKDIFLFAIRADFLLQITSYKPRDEDHEEGIQRLYKVEKGKAIAKYIDSENSTMPNNIIINLNLDLLGLKIDNIYDKGYLDFDVILNAAKKHKIEENQIAFVIDGQHRLRAFEYANNKDFMIIISAMINLDLSEMAEIFVKINFYQTPVNKSRAYDLIRLGEKVFPEYINHQNLTRRLNENIESPLYNKIKMLGIGDGLISQASIIDSLIKFRILDTLNIIKMPPFANDNLYNILWIYFDFIKSFFDKQWKSCDSPLTKTLGIRALLKSLKDIIMYFDQNKLEFNHVNLESIFKKVPTDFWYSTQVLSYGGEKGVKLLSDKLTENLLK